MHNAHQFPKVRGAMEIALFIQNIQEERAEVATCLFLPISISLRQVALYIFSRNQSNSEIAAVDQSDKNRCIFLQSMHKEGKGGCWCSTILQQFFKV